VTNGRRGCGWRAILVAAASVTAATAADTDMEAVKIVCGRCHAPAVFLKQTRSWERWNDVFADMSRRGANGSDEQLARVTTFFLENLTVINVNTSNTEELAGVLGIPDAVAETIITARQNKPFRNLAQLKVVPGVDAEKLEQRKSRILF
jgi:DNA uptake protein ComE-like DNA-binding protein